MVDTNVRSVKRTEQGATILTKATEKMGSLCNHCGIQRACEYRSRLDAIHRAAQLTAPVTRCSLYQYPIHFVSTIGIDTEGFNTVRMGEAWAKRLQTGDTVGLLNHDKQLIRSLKLSAVDIAPMTVQGLLSYAHKNHMMVGQTLNPEQCAERLLKILRNNYGKLVFERSASVTVITF